MKLEPYEDADLILICLKIYFYFITKNFIFLLQNSNFEDLKSTKNMY